MLILKSFSVKILLYLMMPTFIIAKLFCFILFCCWFCFFFLCRRIKFLFLYFLCFTLEISLCFMVASDNVMSVYTAAYIDDTHWSQNKKWTRKMCDESKQKLLLVISEKLSNLHREIYYTYICIMSRRIFSVHLM